MIKNYFKIAWRNLWKNKAYFCYKYYWPCYRHGGLYYDHAFCFL